MHGDRRVQATRVSKERVPIGIRLAVLGWPFVLRLVCAGYALGGLLLGFLFLVVPALGLPLLAASVLVALGVVLDRRRPLRTGLLLIVGGFVQGACLGVFGAGDSEVGWASAILVGGFVFGAPPIVAGGLFVWPSLAALTRRLLRGWLQTREDR